MAGLAKAATTIIVLLNQGPGLVSSSTTPSLHYCCVARRIDKLSLFEGIPFVSIVLGVLLLKEKSTNSKSKSGYFLFQMVLVKIVTIRKKVIGKKARHLHVVIVSFLMH